MSSADLSILIPAVFGGVSFVAGTLNVVFIRRAISRDRALREVRGEDVVLHRISHGFIYTWGFIILNDVIRVVVGSGVLLGHPSAVYLLLLSPFGSLLVAVIGLRSFR